MAPASADPTGGFTGAGVVVGVASTSGGAVAPGAGAASSRPSPVSQPTAPSDEGRREGGDAGDGGSAA